MYMHDNDSIMDSMNEDYIHFSPPPGRNFLPIKGSASVFQSEVVKPKGETMYRPLTEDLLINMRHIEQVSFGMGVYFIGDHRGNYVRSDQGKGQGRISFEISSKTICGCTHVILTLNSESVISVSKFPILWRSPTGVW